MKTISILAMTLATAMFSCSKNDVYEDINAIDGIRFVNLNDKITTRGANDIDANFGVYAISQNDLEFGKDWLMENTVVNGSDYSYAPTKFWPASGVVNFYSYAPASSLNIDLSPTTYGNGDDAKLAAVYTVPNDAQEDFTIAKSVKGVNYKGQTKSIELLFGHALSQVKFDVKLDETTLGNDIYDFTVKSITLDVPYDRNNISLETQLWDNAFSRGASYTPYFGATNSGHYNILPQTLTVDDSATITIGVTITDKITGDVYIDGNIKPFVLNGTFANFTQFESGKSYTFTVVVGTDSHDVDDKPIFDQINFTSGLTPWSNTPVSIK